MIIVFNVLISLFFWLSTAIYVVLIFIPIIILTYLAPSLLKYIKRWWGKLGILSLMLPKKFSGFKNIPAGPIIIIANHTSIIDIYLLSGYLPKNFSYLVKEELFNIPVFGTCIKNLGSYPISRRNAKKAFETTHAIIKSLKENNETILGFPEGTRNKTNELLPFKNGLFKIALAAQLPLLPVAVKGCAQVFGKHKFIAKRHPVSISVGQPIYPEKENNKENLEKLKNTARLALAELLKPS